MRPAHNRPHGFRILIKWFTQTRAMRYSVLLLIVINAVTLGMETSPTIMAEYGKLLVVTDHCIIGFFIAEIILRMFGSGIKHFFRDRWNIFDFLVICLSVIPPHSSEFSILRTFRILRILRIISAVPSMRRVINGLVESINSVFAVAVILLMIFYIFSVMGTTFYAGYSQEDFGSISKTMLTLFPIMTLSEWPDIIRLIIRKDSYSWIFFIGFVLITNYTMLNLLIGIIVNTMQNVVHIDEETYQGVDRRKRILPVPASRERRKRQSALRAASNEEAILMQINHLQEQMEAIKVLIQSRKDI